MIENIPEFPFNDDQVKNIALLGYTGVGKTSLITAAYSENITYGKDAFTQRFFQRIEDEIRITGQMPLTMGEASTLSFIEPQSRSEFSVQDFSGEHIKLERKEEKSYKDLIVRADNAHALLCLISAPSFYRAGRIHEEVDAIQTFVNELRGLGTRIPVAVLLTKCDLVPRYYVDFPILKSICRFFSSLPFLSLSAEQGLELTRRRFPSVFLGLDFKGKGPRTQFMGIALPRLAGLKGRSWPAKLEWLVRLMRKIWINPRFIFNKSYQLHEPFHFCFQAFQLSNLRNLLVRHHQESEICQQTLKQFQEGILDKKTFGEEFYFQDYYERILDDTKSLIVEMEEEIDSLRKMAEKLLTNEREPAQNLQIWLEQARQKICKFTKPWSEGARKSLENLRHETLIQIRDDLQNKITDTLEQTGSKTFYRLIEILKKRRDIAGLPIWKEEQIELPEVEVFQKKLIEHFVRLVLSHEELPPARFQEDRHKYSEVITFEPPEELALLEKLVETGIALQSNLNQYQVSSDDWQQHILMPLQSFQKNWLELSRHFDVEANCPFRTALEQKTLHTLEQQIDHLKSLDQILKWTGEVEYILLCDGSIDLLQKIVTETKQKSAALLEKLLEEMTARSKKCWDSDLQFPERLREWFQDCNARKQKLEEIAGAKGVEQLGQLQTKIAEQAREFMEQLLQNSLPKDNTTTRAGFITILEALQIFRNLEKLDLLSAYGISLPSVAEPEKNLLRHLVLITLNREGLTNVAYEEDRARFLAAMVGEPPYYLQALNTVVAGYQKIMTTGKELLSMPVAERHKTLLVPMQELHTGWLELAGQYELPQEAALRSNAERAAVRCLQESIDDLELRLLRDWIKDLQALVQIEENRILLEKLLTSGEQQIRERLQSDLHDFMDCCRDLIETAEKLEENDEKAETHWQKFAGSVQALTHNVEKFPHAELTVDEEIKNILEHEGPDNFKNSIETWVQSLSDKKMLTSRRCRRITNILDRGRHIFHRPQALLGTDELLKSRLQQLRRKRNWMLVLVACFFLALISVAAMAVLRYYFRSQVDKITVYAQQNFDSHSEVAERWEKLLQYPAWLLPSFSHISMEAAQHRQMEMLVKIENEIVEGKISRKKLREWRKKIEHLMTTGPDQSIQRKVLQTLLEIRSAQLLQQAQDQPSSSWKKELNQLEKMEQLIVEYIPSYQSEILPKVRALAQKQD